MKRFYTSVTAENTGKGFRILLDGRPVKTMMKQDLLVPVSGLVPAVVAEWEDQKQKIVPDSMPLTQILNTMQDRISRERAAIMKHVMKYFDTDLLCYRADFPPELVQKQTQLRQPWIKWFEEKYHCKLLQTSGLTALKQDEAARMKIQKEIDGLSDLLFTVLQLTASLSGSLILSLALLSHAAAAREVFDCVFLEELLKENIYNADKYGKDPMQEKQQKSVLRDLEACALVIEMVNKQSSCA